MAFNSHTQQHIVHALKMFKANNNTYIIFYKYLSKLSLEQKKPAIQSRICIATISKQIQRRGKLLLLLGIEDRVEEQPEKRNGSKGWCFQCG